ncbi:PilZ domain-containing protein [Mitsuaria sp. GD03876]|uniref:PilZ domain-containing protein n=1 Tax=Mitsuaria sp. GD03876 TaxID=2975399 RepID=UPI00244D1344|nr:PilZ domain-containing protein [Mitsuaria sp. GD03876]MDH0867837.1 PilZ domain-containing protein [Mitsuaria sp. GD03876]
MAALSPTGAEVEAKAAGLDAAVLAEGDPEGPAADGADERRGTPRRDVPLGPVVRAEFSLLGRWRSLHVDDVSLGGLGLRGSIEEGRGLFLGQRIAQARVLVGDHVVLVADLEVRIRRSFRSFLAGEQVHIGCRFVGLDARGEAQLHQLLSELAAARAR